MAQARHAQHVNRDHGNPGGIIPIAQPTSASSVGSVEQLTSTLTFSPSTISSSEPSVPSTSTMPTSISDMTVTPLIMSEPITSMSMLPPISAPLGTIISMPQIFAPTDSTFTIQSSNFGSLEHSSSTNPPS